MYIRRSFIYTNSSVCLPLVSRTWRFLRNQAVEVLSFTWNLSFGGNGMRDVKHNDQTSKHLVPLMRRDRCLSEIVGQRQLE